MVKIRFLQKVLKKWSNFRKKIIGKISIKKKIWNFPLKIQKKLLLDKQIFASLDAKFCRNLRNNGR